MRFTFDGGSWMCGALTGLIATAWRDMHWWEIAAISLLAVWTLFHRTLE